MAETLLSTKLFIPPLNGDGLVQRSALQRILSGNSGGKLTLISAPAGFGKSTLVANWLSGQPTRAAWVSLDAEDNDPGVFWQYVLAALQTVEPDFGLDARQIISSPQLLNPQPALVSMLNEISKRSLKFTLALDDCHVIDSQGVHDSLSFFIEHLPATARIVLLTRTDPPLSLG